MLQYFLPQYNTADLGYRYTANCNILQYTANAIGWLVTDALLILYVKIEIAIKWWFIQHLVKYCNMEILY